MNHLSPALVNRVYDLLGKNAIKNMKKDLIQIIYLNLFILPGSYKNNMLLYFLTNGFLIIFYVKIPKYIFIYYNKFVFKK